MQVVVGPRHTGKSTLVDQAIKWLPHRRVVASADGRHDLSSAWITERWQEARALAEGLPRRPTLLVLDEIVRIPYWSDAVKARWDEDTAANRDIQVVLVSSIPLHFQRRSSGVLSGRLEIIKTQHWAFREMRDAFGWDIETYMSFGGYPEAAGYVPDRHKWERFVWDILTPSIFREDILPCHKFSRPELLSEVLAFSARTATRRTSFKDIALEVRSNCKGRTVARALDLLSDVWLVAALQSPSSGSTDYRRKQPRLQVWNTAFLPGQFVDTVERRWLLAAAICAHLLTSGELRGLRVWEREDFLGHIDFVFGHDNLLSGVDTQSRQPIRWGRNSIGGLSPFLCFQYEVATRPLISLERLFMTPAFDILIDHHHKGVGSTILYLLQNDLPWPLI